SLLPSQKTNLCSLLVLVRALGQASFTGQTPRLWLATRGALLVEASPLALAQSPMHGLGLGIAREHPELATTRIDLDPNASIAAQAESLLHALARASSEDVLALRTGG